MGVYIKGMEMPKVCYDCDFCTYGFCSQINRYVTDSYSREEDCPIIELQPHGRLIDADALRRAMYREAFETDSPMQKWDSGCWIRYKMFERAEENAPTIVPAEEVQE